MGGKWNGGEKRGTENVIQGGGIEKTNQTRKEGDESLGEDEKEKKQKSGNAFLPPSRVFGGLSAAESKEFLAALGRLQTTQICPRPERIFVRAFG